VGISSWSIKTKLLGTVGLLVASIVAVCGMSLYALAKIDQELNVLYEQRTRPVAWLGEIYGLQLQNIQELDRALSIQSAAATAAASEQIAANRPVIQQRMHDWDSIIHTQEGRKLHDEIARTRGELVAATDEAHGALAAGNYSGARKIRDEKIEPAFETVRKTIATALEFQLGRAKESRDTANALYQSQRNGVIGIAVVGIATSLVLALMLIRSLMTSLSAAVSVSANIAQGRLGNRVVIRSQDELGKLLQSLQQMDAKLHDIVSSVSVAADSVGVATRQLSQGNDDLSNRTQEQAAAIEETAASMEQMTATVKQNADNARHANQLAAGARSQAEKSGAVVSQAVMAMEEINESSRRIADIIGVIDEIAFQTNLLALNAAVEAARAGEQGRGFAVVATEVRSLAQRSATAAKEIKHLINDSVDKVQSGTELVGSSGTVLTEIMESVKKVSDIVAEISAASEEQATGIEQVNKAVTQMDESTQQNAALVEEAAAASKSIESQAGLLVSQMSFLRQRKRGTEAGAAIRVGDQPGQEVGTGRAHGSTGEPAASGGEARAQALRAIRAFGKSQR
jgi:methyl-accepting chemotaxis protein-1 (serine sensor receptor)